MEMSKDNHCELEEHLPEIVIHPVKTSDECNPPPNQSRFSIRRIESSPCTPELQHLESESCFDEKEKTLSVPRDHILEQNPNGMETLTRSWNRGTTIAKELTRKFMNGKQKYRRRLIFKSGDCNISHLNIKKRQLRYLADMFTTLLDIKWRYLILLFVFSFTMSWLGFSVIWWLIGYLRGDFLPENSEKSRCVDNVNDFTTALLFSIETQHTIGYGGRQVTPKCPEAVILVMVQSCCGVIIQALMTGLVFAKVSRSKKRAETLMFSKNAVICKRDGIMTLLFRVGDMRKSHIICTKIRGRLIRRRMTAEGEVLPMEQYNVDFGSKIMNDEPLLIWPIIITHEINETSPFWEMSKLDLSRETFELVVILEGVVDTTGATTQARSSYIPSEILWGHSFQRLITYQKNNGQYQIDYQKFHSVQPILNFPECSARELAEQDQDILPAMKILMDDDQGSIASKSNTLSRNNSAFGSFFKKQAKTLKEVSVFSD